MGTLHPVDTIMEIMATLHAIVGPALKTINKTEWEVLCSMEAYFKI